MTPPQKPKLYTVPQVAEYLGVGRSLVYDLMARRALRSIKVGRMRRIPESALIDFITNQLSEEKAS